MIFQYFNNVSSGLLLNQKDIAILFKILDTNELHYINCMQLNLIPIIFIFVEKFQRRAVCSMQFCKNS